MKICPCCGNYAEDSAAFCNTCGATLATQAQPQIQPQMQPQAQSQTQPQMQPQAAVPVAKTKKGFNKKLIPIIAIVLVIAIIAVIAIAGKGGSGNGNDDNGSGISASDQLAKLNPSEGLDFSSNGDGTCTWIGIGTCTDTTIVIPEKYNDETVTTINNLTCPYDAAFTKIILADTITTINDYAFTRCTALEEVVLNEGLKSIGKNAFNYLENLKKVNFPSTLETIGDWAFTQCHSLTEVHLNEGLTTLGEYAFNDCTGIQKLTIPQSIQRELSFNFDFNTASLTEINLSTSWKYFYLNLTEDYSTGKISSDVRITPSLSYVKYPGFYTEISSEDFALAIANACNKKTLTVNGTFVDKSTIKPVGKFVLPKYSGAVEREFTTDGNIKYTWVVPAYPEDKRFPDVCISPIVYNDELNMFTSTFSATIEGTVQNFDTYILNYGDYLLVANSTDTLKSGKIYISYEQYMKEFVGDIDLSGVSTEKLEEVEEKKTDLLAELIAEFNSAGIKVTVNETTGELALDSSVLFGGDSSELTAEGAAFIDKFISIYTRVIFSEKYNGFVSKTLVEGHTAPTGTSYEADLPLSEARANSVLNYCKTSANATNPEQVASTFEAVGYSNSKPVYTNSGTVDMDASRRVAFKLVLNIQ